MLSGLIDNILGQASSAAMERSLLVMRIREITENIGKEGVLTD